MLSCSDDGRSPPAPTASPTGTFALLSASPPAGGTVELPAGFFDFPEGNGWVEGLTVTIQFSYSEPISDASVFIVLWRGAQQCVVAEGLVLGAPYGRGAQYLAGSTITQSGNSFTGTSFCRAGAVAGERSFTTDRLQFVLMDLNRAAANREVFTQDLAMGWRFE
jgi:hypothetical protein